jgi:PRTRC genetic system ThiF family protein
LNVDSLPGNIIISCVDNVAARKLIYNYVANCSIHEYHERINNLYWIDTGNGKDFGQVVLSTEKPKLDNVLDMFPNMEKDEILDDTPSCSLAEALEKQDLFINTFVAITAAQLVWDLTQLDELNWRGAFINLKKQIPIRRIQL